MLTRSLRKERIFMTERQKELHWKIQASAQGSSRDSNGLEIIPNMVQMETAETASTCPQSWVRPESERMWQVVSPLCGKRPNTK